MPDNYKIIRFRQRGGSRVVKKGLTLEPSSSTCQLAINRRRTKEGGPWFDGYDHQ